MGQNVAVSSIARHAACLRLIMRQLSQVRLGVTIGFVPFDLLLFLRSECMTRH